MYGFIKILPTKNKITFISRQSNNISYDFDALSKKMISEKKFNKVVVLSKKMERHPFKMFLYSFHLFRQMYNIAIYFKDAADGVRLDLLTYFL
jgi:hypothetical protein